MDNELLLIDRLGVIRDTINSYGVENFYLSFSGGKDSTIIHHLLDMALPGNKIPRVYINTGIEYNAMVEHVKSLADQDNRIVIIKPQVNIAQTLKKYGYPFKSKRHSYILNHYQHDETGEHYKDWQVYIGKDDTYWGKEYKCPQILLYQFTKDYQLKVSDKCCLYMKEKPLEEYSKTKNKPYGITGLRQSEGGRRRTAQCLAFQKGKLKFFQPLVKVDKDWESWFVDKYNIKLCKLYYSPYNFRRTGCKGCPFALDLQKNLEYMAEYMPTERKQCEIIWKPVYEEYRKLGYRLEKDEQLRLF